jgi:hypothetical protein
MSSCANHNLSVREYLLSLDCLTLKMRELRSFETSGTCRPTAQYHTEQVHGTLSSTRIEELCYAHMFV